MTPDHLNLKAPAVSLRLLLSVLSLGREWAAGELIAVCSKHSVPVVAGLDSDLEQTPEVHRAAMVNAYDAGAGGILVARVELAQLVESQLTRTPADLATVAG